MTSLAFFHYRVSALRVYLAEQLVQLKQLGIITMLFMYSALPGIALLVYLALGKILTQDREYAALLAVCLLIAQSLM